MQPDAVDAEVGESLEQRIGVRVERRVGQRVAVDGRVGVDEPQAVLDLRRRPSSAGCATGLAKSPTNWKRGSSGLARSSPNSRPTNAFISAGAATRRVVRGDVRQRLAPRLDLAELHPEEIVLPQDVRQPLGRHAEQRQELVVRQQVPVPPDERGVPRDSISGGTAGFGGKPIDVATARTFSADVPSTSASRPGATSPQFRQTNACSRSGKCGTPTGARLALRGKRSAAVAVAGVVEGADDGSRAETKSAAASVKKAVTRKHVGRRQ